MKQVYSAILFGGKIGAGVLLDIHTFTMRT